MLTEALSITENLGVECGRECSVKIGGVRLALRGDSPDVAHLSSELESFAADAIATDISVIVQCSSELRAWRGERVFDSGALWTLYHDAADFIFDFVSPRLGVHPYKRLCVDQDFRSAQLILNRKALGDGPIFPLEYPADELLFTNYLTYNGLGVEVHGCGLVDAEAGGQLFLGHSGAGKSTTARLWDSLREPEILSDDRIILRLHHGELWMYGTPWHGEAAFALPRAAKLNRIFVLQHGSNNGMTSLSCSRAVGELFARCFPPFHSAEALHRTVAFLEQTVNTVPCYEFQFVPEASAVQAVLEFHG